MFENLFTVGGCVLEGLRRMTLLEEIGVYVVLGLQVLEAHFFSSNLSVSWLCVKMLNF